MNLKPELKCHIVPTEHGNMLVPDDFLVDIMVLDQASINSSIMWRGRNVPLFVTSAIDHVYLSDRIAIIKTITMDQKLPFFAIKVSGLPHSIYVGEETMNDEERKEMAVIAARWVRVGNLLCVIPDLPKIEQYVQERMK